jgi:hypothetical protein
MLSAHVHDVYSFSVRRGGWCELDTWHTTYITRTLPATQTAVLEEMAYFCSSSGGKYELQMDIGGALVHRRRSFRAPLGLQPASLTNNER